MTIAVLLKVANGLSRRASELLSAVDVGRQYSVMRRGERQCLSIKDKGAIEHLVGTIPRNKLDVWRIRIEPGVGVGVGVGMGMGVGMAGTDSWQFRGEIVILVEEGRIEVEIGDEEFVIESGDSIHFDPSLPHRWVAAGDRSAQAIVLATIPERFQGDLMERITSVTGANSFEISGIEAIADSFLSD